MAQLVTDVIEAIGNAAENGYPVDGMSDRDLAEDLWAKASFVGEYHVDILELAVKAAREQLPTTYYVYADYGFTEEELILATADHELAQQSFWDHEHEDRRIELAFFLSSGEYEVEKSNGGPLP